MLNTIRKKSLQSTLQENTILIGKLKKQLAVGITILSIGFFLFIFQKTNIISLVLVITLLLFSVIYYTKIHFIQKTNKKIKAKLKTLQ